MKNAQRSMSILVLSMLAGLVLAMSVPLSAQTTTTIYRFNMIDGANPSALVQGTDGNFYGTTFMGGAHCETIYFGCGTAFRISPTGVFTKLHDFCEQGPPDCVDGTFALGTLALGTDGDFYGTTTGGGVFNTHGVFDEFGTVFKIDASGNYDQLLSFAGVPTEGSTPDATLLLGPDGNFYGTTYIGGASGAPPCVSTGCGTIFRVTPTGTLTTLYSFCVTQPCVDGYSPRDGLVEGTDGAFYGTTTYGGLNGSLCGTAFRITPAGKFVSLHSFRYLAEGCGPETLIQSSDGNFYGTASGGGAHGAGTFFRMTPTGKITKLYDFCAQPKCTDGAVPLDVLIQATDGNFYGTTFGSIYRSYDSVIFSITPDGTFTVLHTFDKATEHSASSGLVQSTDGSFFGGTGNEGQCSNGKCGTLFHLSVGLGPFVRTLPNVGTVGRVIGILGNNLTGVTSVTFNGTPAAFKVISDTYLKAQVPTGATTGKIQVTTPSGTLSSNVAFQVLP